ncbi:MAG: transcription antitermination factor NusB [Bacteroidales bacterium]|nr:transcription antitermination factor NusB [Bacteroidales bacterium]
MLSRRHLRVKVLQALYSFFISGNDRLDLAEKELLRSLTKLHELFFYQLSLIPEIVDFAKRRIEEGKKKFIPSEEDLHPNTKFINNRFIAQLACNRDYIHGLGKFNVSWTGEMTLIGKLYQQIRESSDYKAYVNSPEGSYQEDKEFINLLVRKHLMKSEALHSFYEERHIYWSDDFFTANLLLIKLFKEFSEDWDEDHHLPPLLKDNVENGKGEDHRFFVNLFLKSIIHSHEYEELIRVKLEHWELERVAAMDMIILKMALAEFLEFQSIPIKVSLNEYIEISKIYSTPKSKVFVNGILDKLIADLKAVGQIKKSGRGLIDS